MAGDVLWFRDRREIEMMWMGPFAWLSHKFLRAPWMLHCLKIYKVGLEADAANQSDVIGLAWELLAYVICNLD